MINEEDVVLGDVVKFRTDNPVHAIVISGTVKGIVDVGIARTISDVDNYNEEVKRTLPAIDPTTDMKFVIIRHEDGSQSAYSLDWIKDWESITENGDAKILFRNVSTTDVDNIIAYATSMNIRAKVVK